VIAIGGFVLWLITVGTFPGGVAKLHYWSLFGTATATALIAMRRSNHSAVRRSAAAAAIRMIACLTWYQFDTYKIVRQQEEWTTVTGLLLKN